MTPRDLTTCASAAHAEAQNWLLTLDLDCIGASDADNVAWLKECMALGDMSGIGNYFPAGSTNNVDGWIGPGAWSSRALTVYMQVRPSVSSDDRLALDRWFLTNAKALAANVNWWLAKVFPNRLAGDYSVRASSAASGSMYVDPPSVGAPLGRPRFYYQGSGPISNLSQAWNNRMANAVLFFGLVGIWIGDAQLTAWAIRYVQEHVTYSVTADGAQGEWRRSDEYATPQQGMVYGAHNWATDLILMDELAKAGDMTLAHWSTQAGLWGTEAPGAPKTVWTAPDKHWRIAMGLDKLKTDLGNPIDPWKTSTGRPDQTTWALPVAKRWGRDAPLQMWCATPLAAGEVISAPFGKPWVGMAAMYGDVRAA